MGAELFHADGRTDRWTDKETDTDEWTDVTKLTIAFRDFANAPKNVQEVLQRVRPCTYPRNSARIDVQFQTRPIEVQVSGYSESTDHLENTKPIFDTCNLNDRVRFHFRNLLMGPTCGRKRTCAEKKYQRAAHEQKLRRPVQCTLKLFDVNEN